MLSSMAPSSEGNGQYRRSIMEYISNTNMIQDNSLEFEEDLETTDPLFRALINANKELKAYFGESVPKILNGAHYKVTSVVGRGSQGLVMLARNTADGKLYVIKMSNRLSNPNVVYRFLKEFMFQEHAHSVLQGTCAVPEPKGFIRVEEGGGIIYMMVSEFCSVIPDAEAALSMNQAIKEHMNHKPILSLTEWRDVCVSLIDAVNTLQSNDIYHIDLKTDNILLQFIDDTVHPVIIDFGISVRRNNGKSGAMFAPGPNAGSCSPERCAAGCSAKCFFR